MRFRIMTNGSELRGFRIQKKTLFGWRYEKRWKSITLFESFEHIEVFNSEKEAIDYIRSVYGTSAKIDYPWVQYVRMK